MNSASRRFGLVPLVGAALGLALVSVGLRLAPGASAAPAPAYVPGPMPAEVDSLTSLEGAAGWMEACAPACRGLVYAWTPRMPLSRAGIPSVVQAAQSLGLTLLLVSTEELLDYGEGSHPAADAGLALADGMLEAGVLAHAPALVVVSGGGVAGAAILGYKRTEAYEALVSERLQDPGVPAVGAGGSPPLRWVSGAERAARDATQVTADRPAVGLPGAYFRWVPGTRMIAYESDRSIYLLDLDGGGNRVAPGWIDFVPTPDGRYFVTPGPQDEGLTFFDARDVFLAAERERSMSVEPVFTDMRMRDQYPSVGILEQTDAYTRYRVLTSWFRGLLYRDYEVRLNAATGVSSVRPIGEPVTPCEGLALSTPIMSQTGREVAARDERTGTTKILSILDDGRCAEVVDFGMPTSKVAWHQSGQKVAFSTPRRGRGDAGGAGVFVLDRASRQVTSVPGSAGASRLAFPDFVGDGVVFLVPGNASGSGSFFRLVEGAE